MSEINYNFVAVAKNTAKLSGTFSAFGTVTGGEPQNLVDFEETNERWLTETAGPHATELYVTYPTAKSTRALHFGGGKIPIFGTRVRAVRGYGLAPMLVLWDTETAATNATGTIDRTVDPRAAVAGTFVGASTPGSDWSVTLDFATPEYGFSTDRDQRLVIVAQSSADDGDPTMQVEVKDSGGVFVDFGTVTVSQAVGGSGETPRYSIRLAAADLETPAEVRISGTFVATGDLQLHGLAIVGPVDPDNGVQRLTGSAYLDTTGSTAGTPLLSRHNPLDDEIAADEGMDLLDQPSSVRAALDADDRDLVSADLLFTWQPGSAADSITVKLFHEITGEIATIATYAPGVTTIQNEIDTVALGGLPDADGQGLEIEFSRTAGTGTTRITGVALHTTVAATAIPSTHDTGWSDLEENDSSLITGGEAIDKVGRSIDVSFSRDWRASSPAGSLAVLAPETYVDLDVPNDPEDADIALTLANQIARSISFRSFIEGPGLPTLRIAAKGVSSTPEDASVIRQTLGGFPIVVRRRVRKRVSFNFHFLDVETGPGQLAQVFQRMGTTDPVLMIALPQVPGFSPTFSVFGLITTPGTIDHFLKTESLTAFKVEVREF